MTIKTRYTYIVSAIFCALLFLLTIRGRVGNPTANEIDFEQSTSGKAFETSQERSRYAIILSLVNDHTFAIDNYASMGTPDIGRINGHYYSFFPPGASLIAIPFFLVGQKLGIAQMAVFSVSTLFSIFTMMLLVKFAKKLGLGNLAAIFAAMAFGFATNAWGYSVTFYAHLISAFFILLGLYFTAFYKGWKEALLFWLSYSIAVFIDFPNLFIFLPMAIFQGLLAFRVIKERIGVKLEVDWKYIITPFLFVFLMFGYAYYNYVHFGSPTRLSNTIPRVKDLKEEVNAAPESGRESVGALNTRNMLEGFHSFLISRDRGLLIYTPVAFLALFGLGFLRKEKKHIEVFLFITALTCLVLYTMFGDPYGGWAFGSRYVLAVMPEMCLLAALGLQRFRNRAIVKIVYSVVFLYSSAVCLLAPLTTNVIPPFVEARYINLKYDYGVNIDMLNKNQLNSFLYNTYFSDMLTGWQYYTIIFIPLALFGLFLIWGRQDGEGAL
jgi:hypothetical protein